MYFILLSLSILQAWVTEGQSRIQMQYNCLLQCVLLLKLDFFFSSSPFDRFKLMDGEVGF